MEASLYLTSTKKKQVNQIKGMKERAHLREMVNLMSAVGRAQKEKTPPARTAPNQITTRG